MCISKLKGILGRRLGVLSTSKEVEKAGKMAPRLSYTLIAQILQLKSWLSWPKSRSHQEMGPCT